MPTRIDVLRENGLERIILQNEAIRAVILPDLGGKIGSLVNLKTGREFLLQPFDRPYSRARYGDSFGAYDSSGFDECLPTIAACSYPSEPFSGANLPDHGEVWSLPWKYEIRNEELVLDVDGVALPYNLRRTARLSGAALELDYQITNRSEHGFHYLWSAHPALTVEPGAEIVLPPGVHEVSVDFSVGNRLPLGKAVAWPAARAPNGSTVNLNFLGGREAGTADKLFTPRLSEGYCGLRFPSAKESIFFRFDPGAVPFVGLWICQGGFPLDRPAQFTVALEPCSGRPDLLTRAIANNECPELAPHASRSWSLRLELEPGIHH